jgi:hypothetical protein
VHFKGALDSKHVYLTIEFWDGARKAATDQTEPFAESIMRWIGLFTSDPILRAATVARFRKPHDTWRSRFNLPFKVQMAKAEVVIDGVSLILPRNTFRASSGFLGTTKSGLIASVQLSRDVDLATFNIGSEVASFNEALKMFMEPIA